MRSDVYQRRQRLVLALREAGLDPEHWPWRRDTAQGLQQHAELEAKSKELGELWWITWLEERLATELQEKHPAGWADVDTWTRQDFINHVKQDKRDGRSGSKGSIAKRALMSPTALWRRWERVRRDGESWPSGKKGPADRQ